MMRMAAVMWFVAAAVVAGFLFHVKYEVMNLEKELRLTQRQILQEEEEIRILKAEWSYLNRPQVLAKMAEEHLGLTRSHPEQLVSLTALPSRPGSADDDAAVVLAAGAAPVSETGMPLPKVKPVSLQSRAAVVASAEAPAATQTVTSAKPRPVVASARATASAAASASNQVIRTAYELPASVRATLASLEVR